MIKTQNQYQNNLAITTITQVKSEDDKTNLLCQLILPENIDVDSVRNNIRAHLFGCSFLGANINTGVEKLRSL